MRRIPALLVLLAATAFWAGCGSDTGSTPNTNAPGTTTYGNSAPSSSGGATSAPSSSGNANRRPGDTGIKPPTDK